MQDFDKQIGLTPSDFDGLSRSEAEALRLDRIKARGAVPPDCGDAAPMAPARGAVRVFEGVTLYPDGDDGWKAAPSGYRGRKTMCRADAFDVMEGRARKPLFTPVQKAMGRFYAALHEKHAVAGVKCASLEGRVDRSGSGGGEFIDAVLRDRERLAVLRARVGDGLALRKLRPSARGSRVSISDMALVDAVCIEDRTITEVLIGAGWTKAGKSVVGLRQALCDALERMMGPQPRGGVVVSRFGV